MPFALVLEIGKSFGEHTTACCWGGRTMTHPDPRYQYSHHYASHHHQGNSQRRHWGNSQHQGNSAYQRDVSFPPDFRQPSPQSAYRNPPQRTAVQPKRRRKVRSQPRSRGVLLASGSMLALAALVVVPKPASEDSTQAGVVCQEKVQSQSVLSRAELSQLLAVPERASKEAVRQVIEAPYCLLNSVQVREGAIAEREAYPLEFDPQTWFIVLYKDGEYAGYDFSFQRE